MRIRRRVRLGAAFLSVLFGVGVVLVAAGGPAAAAKPPFQLPLPCGQVWTTSTHSGHASQYMVDMVNTNGPTAGTPALAATGGTVVTSGYFSDAGNMIVIDHGGGWQTRYLHLQTRYLGAGDDVGQGQEIGIVGNTGSATTGAHLHFEEKLNGTVVQAEVAGHLIPVTWSYYEHTETSENCGGPPPPSKVWVDIGSDAPGSTTRVAPGPGP